MKRLSNAVLRRFLTVCDRSPARGLLIGTLGCVGFVLVLVAGTLLLALAGVPLAIGAGAAVAVAAFGPLQVWMRAVFVTVECLAQATGLYRLLGIRGTPVRRTVMGERVYRGP